MSMHKVPLTPTEEAGFHAHGLQRNIGKPSQLADVFRQGVAWGIAAERERWMAASGAVSAGAEAAGRHGVQTVTQIRLLALGPNVRAKPGATVLRCDSA